MEHTSTLISCLLPAGNSPEQMARAILCYQQQTWQQKELLVIDSGLHDLAPLLEDIPETELQHIRTDPALAGDTGSLKNIGLQKARGDVVIHWDPAAWHHPERMRHQLAHFEEDGIRINWFSAVLLHLDDPELVHHPYIDAPKSGCTGSLMHANSPEKRYPERHKHPDRAFLANWDLSKAQQLDAGFAWLIIHGLAGDKRNRRRFMAGLRSSTGDAARLIWLKLRGRDSLAHPRFRLNERERDSFQKYLKESQKLGVLTSIS